MDRLRKFAARYAAARRYGVTFLGTSYTHIPRTMQFGGTRRQIKLPDDAPLVADFIDVVLDDDYGLREITGSVRTIVDIGANVGMFSNHARDCFPEATIHAYEPSPTTAELARFNSSHPLTTVYEEGVSGADGHADMVELGASNIARTQACDGGAITLTSFANVLARAGGHIDILKVDCEGAEWDFMTDAALFANVDRIRMEYHLIDGRDLHDVTRLVQFLGYRVGKLTCNSGFGIVWMDR
ncbi:MAG: methyltransferase FkbM family [Sphingomonas bacterium]|uniref:FkbM family methyltransferase n=1 Tax=Sphingomonas bacterium TaxID=1895847 RepID=UPI0026308787|nr:FkbM family methyltransferase [Sphingomonas bacterium]MDB5711388.1 methyltransferase FkbM family [Sphingomonas bacterium]